MTKIEILGSGCQKCRMLFETVQKIVNNSNIEAQVEKVEDINQILAYGIMTTPALVVDGVVKIAGRIPKPDEIKNMIMQQEKQ